MAHDGESLGQYLSAATSVLLLAPAHSDPDDDGCVDLLSTTDPANTNVLSVTFDETPDDRLLVWQDRIGDQLPKRATILDARPGVERLPQSSTAASEEALDIEMLPPDADLMDVGLAVAQQLGVWQQTAASTQVCFHAVSALLDRFDTPDLVTFVTGLNELCDDLDVFAHYHVDPAACDEATLVTLRPLFDAVVEYDGEGWIVVHETAPDDRPTFRQPTASSPERANETVEQADTIPIRYSFDTVLSLLSSPLRRTLLYHLKDRSADTIQLDTLIDEIHRRAKAVPSRDAPPRAQLEKTLVHNHLPRLEDAGVIEFDRTDDAVHYEPNPALVSCLRYFETLELG